MLGFNYYIYHTRMGSTQSNISASSSASASATATDLNMTPAATASAILRDSIYSLKHSLINKSIDVESSISYLERKDVEDKFADILTNYHDSRIDSKIGVSLGLAYLECYVTKKDGSRTTINFWPCSSCACIGVETNNLSLE